MYVVVLLVIGLKIDFTNSSGHVATSLNVDFDNFVITEKSYNNGFQENIKNIDINLPGSSWKINDIELNFTNVEFIPEIIAIEDQPANFQIIDKFHDGYGVQIVIEDPTIIYGVYIFGNNKSSENLPVNIQINGFNDLTHSPNNTIFGASTILNMSYSEVPSWHLQIFPAPIYLFEGNYYFVIDGTIIGNSPKSDYFWYFNNLNPSHPELHSSSLDGGSWSIGTQGSPFLYKLLQKVNISIFPDEINMTAQIGDNWYKVLNGNDKGEGYLKKNNINYHPNKSDLCILVKNNKTNGLNFNLEYTISMENDYFVSGCLTINFNDLDYNQWSIFPSIIRKSSNYSIFINYPQSWQEVRVYRNSEEISSDIAIDIEEFFIVINNDTIQDETIWEISGRSLKIPFFINALKEEFRIGQELRFSIAYPILAGNYTFALYDPFNVSVFELFRQIPLESNVFSFQIPGNAEKGNYTAVVFWNNATDAGMNTHVFNIISAELPINNFDFSIFIIIGVFVAGGSSLSFTSYIVIKKAKSNKREKLRSIVNEFSDIMNLEYVIVLDMKSGIDVYSQSFGKKELDSTLISGFLQAIHNFGVEVIEGAKESRTMKVEYQKSIVIMTDFINVRLITIMKNAPSENFLYNIESLAYDIYKEFGKLLEEFEGGLKPFQAIRKLVEKNYKVKFLYPLKVVFIKMKLNQEEREMVKKAVNYMKENDANYFYSIDLLPKNEFTPKDYEVILNLIEKGIFQPIDKGFTE